MLPSYSAISNVFMNTESSFKSLFSSSDEIPTSPMVRNFASNMFGETCYCYDRFYIGVFGWTGATLLLSSAEQLFGRGMSPVSKNVSF